MVIKFKKPPETFSSLWGRLLFWKKAGTKSHVDKIGSKKWTNLSPERRSELKNLCDQLFKRKDLIASGKLQFIGLANIKKRMGRKWAGLSKIVYDTAEDVIDKGMGKGDIFIRYDDDIYVIIFAYASLDEARLRTAKIADEIRRRLFELDEEELRSIEIRAAINEIKTDFLLGKQFPDFLDDLAADIDSNFVVDFQQHEMQAGAEDGKFNLSDLRGVDVDASDYKPHANVPLKKSGLPKDLKFSYLPLWDVKRSALTTYLCLARKENDDRSAFEGYWALYAEQSREYRVDLDRQILDAVGAELENMERDGRKLLIACPVQYETLQNFDSYEVYKQSLERIPEMRRQYLVIYVMGTERGMPPKDAYWFATPLRQFCRHIFAEIPLRRDINFNYLRNTGIDAAGARLNGSEKSEQETIGLMTAFCTRAKMLKMPMTFLLGVPTLSVTTSAVCATFDFLGGPAIHEEVARPDTVHKYRYEDLLSSLVK